MQKSIQVLSGILLSILFSASVALADQVTCLNYSITGVEDGGKLKRGCTYDVQVSGPSISWLRINTNLGPAHQPVLRIAVGGQTPIAISYPYSENGLDIHFEKEIDNNFFGLDESFGISLMVCGPTGAPLTVDPVKACAIVCVRTYQIVSPLVFATSGNQPTPDISFTIRPDFVGMSFESIEPDDGSLYSVSADEIAFYQEKCGIYSYNIKFGYACSSSSPVTFHTIPLSFTLYAPPAEFLPSELPGDQAYLVQNISTNIGYRWLRKVDGTTNNWEELYCSSRGSMERAGTYKVQNVPLVPGCGTQESQTITLSEGNAHLRPSHSLSISVLSNAVKNTEQLKVPDPDGRDVFFEQVSYFDPLGRSIQTIGIKAGQGGEDLVQPFTYDPVWGRQKEKYLPYARAQSGSGAFDPQALQNQSNFYLTHPDVAHDTKPYSSVEFDDNKDLAKVVKAFGSGQDWLNGDKYNKEDGYVYNSSSATFNTYPVYRLFWSVPGGSHKEKAISDLNHPTYWTQELVVKESRSEDDQTKYQFINQLGQMVASRTMPRSPSNDPPLTTYYVYDEMGRLRMSIPPAVSALFGNTSSIVYHNGIIQLAPDLAAGYLVKQLCTRYLYDEKGRTIVTERPGGGSVLTVYDLLDRPILSQDEGQRLGGKNTWSFVKYDREGRTVLTGDIEGGTKDQTTWQNEADAATLFYESRTDSPVDFHGYTDNAFPALTGQSFTLMTVNYYDDYTFKRGNTYGELGSPNPAQEVGAYWETSVLGTIPPLLTEVRSLPTAKKVRVLHPDPSSTEQWLMDIYYYDEKERQVATGSDTHFDLDAFGNDDWHFIQPDPTYGWVMKEYDYHNNQNVDPQGYLGNSLPYWKEYSYLPNGKLLRISQMMAGDELKGLVQFDYDVFGGIKTRHLALDRFGNALQHIDYKRNIRGWLTHINDPEDVLPKAGTQSNGVPPDADVFGMELKYHNLSGPAHSSVTGLTQTGVLPQDLPNRYDGTISGTVWKTSLDHVGRSYTYSYDGFNRLSSANYRAIKNSTTSQWGQHEPNLFHSWDYRYDANGNLTNMQQNGPVGRTGDDTSAQRVDEFDYHYEDVGGNVKGNRLHNVKDKAPFDTYNKQTNLDEKGHPFRRDYNEADNGEATDQYTYDEAGRLISDKGKQIKTIVYNRLDLPEKIQFKNGPDDESSSVITTLYAADGRKLTYTYHRPEGGSGIPEKTVTTQYCHGWVYRVSAEAGRNPESKLDMAYLSTPTGKVVPTVCMAMEAGNMAGNWLYQHHIYDHQGNLRIAFQEEYTKDGYEAGMEQSRAAQEEEEFEFVGETRFEDASLSRTGNYSSKLNPLEGKPLGPMKWIPVEQGDTVKMEAFAHYEAPSGSPEGGGVWQQTLAGFLLGSFANSVYSPTLENGQANPAYQQLVLLGSTLAGMAAGTVTQSDPQVPKAYMKWIHYDKDSVFVSQGFVAITSEASSAYEQLALQTVAEKDGYVQFFLANETTWSVYFDDVSGQVRRPRVIQQAHYYPFGLPMAKITTLGNPEYAYFFTGKELYEDEALEWYDYGARMYDVQIGRWTTTDPEWQDASPYVYCGNNPVNYLDPDGRKWHWYDYGLAVATGGTYAIGKGVYSHRQDIDEWFARNEKQIVKGVMMGVGIGLAFTPLGPVGGIMVACAMGGLQGGLYGGGFRGAIQGAVLAGLSAGLGACAGGVAGDFIGEKAMGKVGNQLLCAGIGGFAGGFVGGVFGASMSGAKGNDLLEAGLIGGATGAGSAMVMSRAVAAVKYGREGRNLWNGRKTMEFGTGQKEDYLAAVKRAESYNNTAKQRDETTLLKLRSYKEFGIREGDLNIDVLSSSPFSKNGDVIYGRSENGSFVNSDGEVVGGFTYSIDGNRSEVHISSNVILRNNSYEFKAYVGHEFIHAYHNYVGLGSGPFGRYDSESTAYHYTVKTLEAGKFYTDAASVRQYAISKNYWSNETPTVYYDLPGWAK